MKSGKQQKRSRQILPDCEASGAVACFKFLSFFFVVSEKLSIFAMLLKKEKMRRNAVLDNIKAVASKTLPANTTLILYGSRARKDNRPDSDWDLLILLDKPSLSFKDYDYGYPFRELGWTLKEEINPQVYSKKEWEDYRITPFYKNVERDKIILI